MAEIRNLYAYLSVGQSPLVDSWPLMKTPLPIVTIIAVYLYFVLRAGPRFMEHRKPMELKGVLVVYNAIQVLFSVWLCSMAFVRTGDAELVMSLGCNGSFPDELYPKLWTGAWWYYFAKILDLLDTVFFILRKNQRQVTFLHVYHHSAMAFWAFFYLKYFFGEQGILIGMLNSFVHIIMYFYYMMSAMGPQYKKYLWWKKYLTGLQLFQFCSMILILVSSFAMGCEVPKAVSIVLTVLIVTFLYLFAKFYIESYGNEKKNTKKIETNVEYGTDESQQKIKTN